MKFHDLINLDQSLQLLFPQTWNETILGIANIDNPLPGHIVFIKNAKILSRLGRLMPNDLDHDQKKKIFSQVGLIFEKSFYKKLSESELSSLEGFAFLAQTDDTSVSMAHLSSPFYQQKFAHLNHMIDGRQMGTTDIHPTAFIGQGVFIGEGVKVGASAKILPGSVIMGECEIGEETVIFPKSTLYPFVKVGKRCRIHSGAVLGADGFGYHFHRGQHLKIWHVGGVTIEDDVEIGANSCVDGGTFAATFVGRGSKLDNHVQVGHNCRLGQGVILCGHVAIGGSSVIGDFTLFGGKSGMGSDMTLGNGCQVAGGALVNCDWPDKSILGGHPARPLKEWMRGLAYVRQQSLSEN